MKKTKIIYWISTGLISLMMLISTFTYLTSPTMVAAFNHLGFPSFFRVELAIAKAIGVVILLLPMVKGRFKEWAYFGFLLTFISAFLAHVNAGDPASVWAATIIAMLLWLGSYLSYHKLHQNAKNKE